MKPENKSLMAKAIDEELTTAWDNGYRQWIVDSSPQTIAMDLCDNSAAFELCEISALVDAVAAWKKAKLNEKA